MKRSINQASSATLKWRIRDMQLQVALAYLGGIPYSVVPPAALRVGTTQKRAATREIGSRVNQLTKE